MGWDSRPLNRRKSMMQFVEASLKRLDEISRIEMVFPHGFMFTEQYKAVVDGGSHIEGVPLAYRGRPPGLGNG